MREHPAPVVPGLGSSSLVRALIGLILLFAGPARLGAEPVTAEQALGLLRGPGETFDAGEGWGAPELEVRPDVLRYRFVHQGGARVEVELYRRDTLPRAFRRTPSFDVAHRGHIAASQALETALLGRVADAVEAHDKGEVQLGSPERETARGLASPFEAGLWAQVRTMHPLDLTLIAVTLLALLAGLTGMGTLARVVARAFGSLPVGVRAATVGLLLGGLVLRLLLPVRMVMIYMGYKLANDAADFATVAKYGAGAFVPYRLLFGAFGPDHVVLANTHAVVGMLGFGLMIVLALRHGADRLTAPLAAALFAFVPLFVKDHRSESLLVLGTFYLWTGLLLLDAWLAEGRWRQVPALVGWLVLAVTTRPEMLPITGVGALAVLSARGYTTVRARLAGLAAVAGLVALASVPHLVHLSQAVQGQLQAGALPGSADWLTERTLRKLITRNAWLDATYFPVALTALAVLALPLLRGTLRRLASVLLVLVVLWTGLTYIDLPATSVPRLHAPPAALLTLLASCGVGALAALLRRARPVLAPALAGVVALGVLGSAAPTVPSLFAITNEDQEDTLIRRALDQLPASGACLVRISNFDDPPEEKTPRHFPDYLLRPPHRDVTPWMIRDYESQSSEQCPAGVYFLAGLRCYVQWWDDGTALIERRVTAPSLFDPSGWRVAFEHVRPPKPPRPVMMSSCERLLARSVQSTVFEETLPNLGDNEFGHYPDVPSFRVGLYRLAPRGGASR